MRSVLAAALLVAATTAGADAVSPPQHVFLEVRISPDGRNVATVEGDVSPSGGAPVVRQLVIRSADGKGRSDVALPCGQARECWPSSPAWTPDSKHVSFALRTPGSHARSIYQVDPGGRGLTQLIAFDGTIDALRYSPGGKLSMLATAGANKELGAVEAGAAIAGDLDAAPPEQRIAVLEQNTLRWASPPDLFVYEYDWQPNGLGFVGTAAAGDGDRNWWIARLFAFSAEDGSARVLYQPASPQQQLAAPRVSRDGKRVAFIVGLMSDFGSTGGEIYTLQIAGGTAIPLASGLPATPTFVHWNCEDHLEATVLAGEQFELLDFGTGERPAAGRLLWQGQESLDSQRADLKEACPSRVLAFSHEAFAQAPEVAVGTPGHFHNLTSSNASLTASFPVRSVTWKNDGLSVQGWLIEPQKSDARQTKPALITIVHGGPAAAAQPHFIGTGTTRLLLEHGYAVFEPNPRGSFGQGEAFTRANVRDFGYGDLRDILAGIDAIDRLGVIDSARLGIMGHSYGGFMTMWAVTQTNRFKAAIAGAGVANWQSYYGENGIDEWLIPYFGASVYDDPAVYARSSPISFVHQARTPTFSYVGAQDIECPAPQTQEYGHALKALGLPSSTVIYADEGHAIHDPGHLADLTKRTLDWFQRYLN